MFEETPIEGLLIYTPRVFKDHRGCFFESFNARHFAERGLKADFVQDNRSVSVKGTLRGLHFQKGQAAQAKLVSVLRGHVYDVAVDLRAGSKTFGKWFGMELHEDKIQSFYIPRGFAHGFVILSDSAEFYYKVDNFYNKDSEVGLAYNDPDLAIDWKIPHDQIILSDKDRTLPSLQDVKNMVAKGLWQ